MQTIDRESLMSDDNARLASIVARYPGLSGHLDESFRKLLLQARQVNYPAGTVLFRESEPCLNFMWLIGGSVRLYKHSEDGRQVTLYRVCAGELCILSINNLLHCRVYRAEACCDEPLYGLMISGQDFLKTMDESPGFRRYVLQTLASRLDDVMSLVGDVVFRRLDLRLACLLGQMFERSHGQPLQITHESLAREIGTSREVISRILKEFENQQCVSLSRGSIHLVSAQGLEWFK